MKTLLAFAWLLAITLTSSQAASAAEPNRPGATKAEADAPAAVATKPRPLPFQGVVSAVSPSARTFTITTKAGKDHLFTITEQTKILKDDAPAKLEDIKPKEVVRGSRLKLGENKWEAIKVIIGAKEKAS